MMPCQMVHSNQSFRTDYFLWFLRQRQQNTSNMSVTAYQLTQNWIFINVPVRTSNLTKVYFYTYIPYVAYTKYQLHGKMKKKTNKQTECYLTMTHACTNPSHVIHNIFYTWHPLHDISYTFHMHLPAPLCTSYYKLLKWNTKWHQLCSHFTGSLVCCWSENGPFQHKYKNITELVTGFLRKLKNKAVTPNSFIEPGVIKIPCILLSRLKFHYQVKPWRHKQKQWKENI